MIVKKANGKTVVKISKREWKLIGEKNGWLKQASLEYEELANLSKYDDGLPPTALDIFKKLKKEFISSRVEEIAREFDRIVLEKLQQEFSGEFDKYDETTIQPVVDYFNNKEGVVKYTI